LEQKIVEAVSLFGGECIADLFKGEGWNWRSMEGYCCVFFGSGMSGYRATSA
jgi:hypothetical protein